MEKESKKYRIVTITASVTIIFLVLLEVYHTRSLLNEIASLEEEIISLENELDRSIPDEPDFMYKTPAEGLIEALYYYDVKYPEIVYAQAILETGHFKSNLCLYGNNLFGLYDSKNKCYHTFDHWAESVYAYKEWVQYRYKENEDYYEFLKRINYAEDTTYISKLKYLTDNDKRRNNTRNTPN